MTVQEIKRTVKVVGTSAIILSLVGCSGAVARQIDICPETQKPSAAALEQIEPGMPIYESGTFSTPRADQSSQTETSWVNLADPCLKFNEKPAKALAALANEIVQKEPSVTLEEKTYKLKPWNLQYRTIVITNKDTNDMLAGLIKEVMERQMRQNKETQNLHYLDFQGDARETSVQFAAAICDSSTLAYDDNEGQNDMISKVFCQSFARAYQSKLDKKPYTFPVSLDCLINHGYLQKTGCETLAEQINGLNAKPIVMTPGIYQQLSSAPVFTIKQ